MGEASGTRVVALSIVGRIDYDIIPIKYKINIKIIILTLFLQIKNMRLLKRPAYCIK